MNSFTEENYLKAIYKLSEQSNAEVSTNEIAERMQTKAASVTDMLKKLAEKKLINYVKYQGVTLTSKGMKVALSIIRKHRLWETFLVSQLKFKWDEVHDIAEELEHINSDELVDRLEQFLGFPVVDPHGDPIPSKSGAIQKIKLEQLAEIEAGQKVYISGVIDHSKLFLQYLDKVGIKLSTDLTVEERNEYDGSIIIKNKMLGRIQLSKDVAKNLLVLKK